MSQQHVNLTGVPIPHRLHHVGNLVQHDRLRELLLNAALIEREAVGN